MLAGLAFAFSPRLLGLAGVLSAEVLPTAVLPWVMLPLVHALRGRYSARLGALLSGSAVLMMGGVNAIENLAALPLPALLILSGLGAANGRRLALWCVATVSAASAWWMLPLLVLGRYSPPFLDYIETSAATTHPLGWMNATRGADHWLAFIHVGGTPWWPARTARHQFLADRRYRSRRSCQPGRVVPSQHAGTDSTWPERAAGTGAAHDRARELVGESSG